MKAILLAGGFGTRLREETDIKPKPMVEVGGKPILWHIMKTFAAHGITDFVVCTGYKGEVIKDYFYNYETRANDFTVTLGKKDLVEIHGSHAETGWRVTVADTGERTMTGGRVRAVQKYVEDEIFCVTYGDGVSDIDITDVINFHRSHGKIATVTAVQPPSRFGLLSIGDTGSVTNFVEKPTLDGWINGGYFVFNRQIFDYLDSAECVLEQSPLMRLAQDGQLQAYKHTGFWFAMDTFRELTILNELWKTNAPWKVW